MSDLQDQAGQQKNAAEDGNHAPQVNCVQRYGNSQEWKEKKDNIQGF